MDKQMLNKVMEGETGYFYPLLFSIHYITAPPAS